MIERRPCLPEWWPLGAYVDQSVIGQPVVGRSRYRQHVAKHRLQALEKLNLLLGLVGLASIIAALVTNLWIVALVLPGAPHGHHGASYV